MTCKELSCRRESSSQAIHHACLRGKWGLFHRALRCSWPCGQRRYGAERAGPFHRAFPFHLSSPPGPVHPAFPAWPWSLRPISNTSLSDSEQHRPACLCPPVSVLRCWRPSDPAFPRTLLSPAPSLLLRPGVTRSSLKLLLRHEGWRSPLQQLFLLLLATTKF